MSSESHGPQCEYFSDHEERCEVYSQRFSHPLGMSVTSIQPLHAIHLNFVRVFSTFRYLPRLLCVFLTLAVFFEVLAVLLFY